MPRAAGLADSIREQFDLEPELKKSSGGAFEVELDGELVFSKRVNGRFPEPGEVEASLSRRLGQR